MDEEHRKLIESNTSSLLRVINLEKLLPAVKEKEIFPPDWIKDLTSGNLSSDIRKKKLLNSLTKRGPRAFDEFLQCLQQTKQIEALKILFPDLPEANWIPQEAGNSPEEVHLEAGDSDKEMFGGNNVKYGATCRDSEMDSRPIAEEGDVTDRQITVSVPIVKCNITKCSSPYGGKDFDSENMYRMERKERGLALIINNIKFEIKGRTVDIRVGAKVDHERMHLLLENLGFTVILRKNLKGKQMENELDTFVKDPRHRNADACVLCIMSHGNQDRRYGGAEVLYGVDGYGVEYNRIVSKFNEGSIPQLGKSPRVVFFQVCRGDIEPLGVPSTIHTDGGISFDDWPTYVSPWHDIFVFQSTVADHKSVRDPVTGTWFIDSIFKVFQEKAHQMHFTQLCREVQRDMHRRFEHQGIKQAGETRQLGEVKEFLYFNPGYYRD